MIVYRLENDEGRGPYQGSLGTPRDLYLNPHSPLMKQGATHPVVHDDVPKFEAGMLSALTSPTALRRWFWGCWKHLEWAGYLVAEFTVPALCVLHGRLGFGQVAFHRDQGKLVRRATLREIVRVSGS